MIGYNYSVVIDLFGKYDSVINGIINWCYYVFILIMML